MSTVVNPPFFERPDRGPHGQKDHDLGFGAVEVLDEQQCYGLLRRAAFGRVGVTVAALPRILPVNFVLYGKEVVFRTKVQSSLMQAVDGRVVAFEVDGIDGRDLLAHEAWSVLVVGWAQRVLDPSFLEEIARLPLEPWAPGEHEAVVRIIPGMVSGRRILRSISPSRES